MPHLYVGLLTLIDTSDSDRIGVLSPVCTQYKGVGFCVFDLERPRHDTRPNQQSIAGLVSSSRMVGQSDPSILRTGGERSIVAHCTD